MVKVNTDVEMTDIRKVQQRDNEGTAEEEEEEEEEDEEYESTSRAGQTDLSSELRRTNHLHAIGLYCGKVIYVAAILGMLLVSCTILLSRTHIEIEDIVIKRAKENKINQLYVVSSMMETLTRTIQNVDLKEQILLDVTRTLNHRHLLGTYEVILVKASRCDQTTQCGVNILSDLRHTKFCTVVDSAVGAGHQCKFDVIASVGARVLSLTSPELAFAMTYEDYTDGEPLSLYAYKMINGTDIGVILKQDLQEVLITEDSRSATRWYSSVIIFISEVVLALLLVIVLQYLQEGRGYISMATLVTVSVAAFLSIIVLMGFTASLDEGIKQQSRETSDSALIFLAVHEAVEDLVRTPGSAVTSGMFQGVAGQWLSSLNHFLPPGHEAHLFEADATPTLANTHLISTSSLRGFCPEMCVASLVRSLANQAQHNAVSLTTPSTHRFLVYPTTTSIENYSRANNEDLFLASYFAASRDGRRRGFAWLVSKDHTTSPFESAVERLWDVTGSLCVGYVVAAATASLLTCYLLPKLDGRGRREQVRLSRSLPHLTIATVVFLLLLCVVSGVVSLRSIHDETEMYKTRMHSSTVALKAADLRRLMSHLESIWVGGLVTGRESSLAEYTSREAVASAGMEDLITEAKVLYRNDRSAETLIAVLEMMPTLLKVVGQNPFQPMMSQRAAQLFRGNNSHVIWAANPDTSIDSARSAMSSIKKDLLTAGISELSSQYAALIDAENALLDLQVTFREFVILSNGTAEARAAFENEYGMRSASFTAKIDSAVDIIKTGAKQALATNQPTIDEARIQLTVENIKSNIEQHRRDSNRFSESAVVDVDAAMGNLVASTVYKTEPLSMTVLQNDLSHEGSISQVSVAGFFGTMGDQLNVIEMDALYLVSRNAFLPFLIDAERTRVIRATTFSILLIVLTCVVAITSLIWYMRDARCNTGPGGGCLAPYPYIEIKDMTIVFGFLLLFLVAEVGLIRHFAHEHLSQIENADRQLTVTLAEQHNVNEWLTAVGQALTWSGVFLITSENPYKNLVMSFMGTMAKHAGSALLANEPPPTLQGLARENPFEAISQLGTVINSKLLASAGTRVEYDTKRGIHTYDTLGLLIKEQKRNPVVQDFFQHLSERRISTQSREEWITSYSKEWVDVTLTSSFDKSIDGHPVERWSPRVLTLDAGSGYSMTFKNDFSAAVTLNIESLVRNSAVRKIYTRDTEWVVPFALSITLQPGASITAEFIVVKTGVYELFHKDRAFVSVQVTGHSQTTGLNPGLSAVAEKRLAEDPRSQSSHPVWQDMKTDTANYFIPPLDGGFFALSPHQSESDRYIQMLEQNRAYRINHHNSGPICDWVLDLQDRFCSVGVSIELSRDLTAGECGMLARGNPLCGDRITSNGRICRCLRKPFTCDYQYSTSQEPSSVYKLRCDYNPDTAQPIQRVTGLDLSVLEGHAIVNEVGDEHASMNVPHVFSVGLRYNMEKPHTPKSAYTEMLVLDEGYYTLTALHTSSQTTSLQKYTDVLGVTRGCFRHTTTAYCYSDTSCVWDGVICTQRETLAPFGKSQLAQGSGTLPQSVLTYLLLSQSAKITHVNHLAFLLSDNEQFKQASEQYEEYFLGNISKVNGQASLSLKMEFAEWTHALKLERTMRSELSGLLFLEDVLMSDPSGSTEVEEVWRLAEDLLKPRLGSLGALQHYSEYSMRFLFWSCCIVAWVVALVCWWIHLRLDIAVRLSEPYCFRNIKTATGFERINDK